MPSFPGSAPSDPRPARRYALSRVFTAFAALLLLGGCDIQRSFLKIPVGGYWERLSAPADSICYYPDWRGDRVVFTVNPSFEQEQFGVDRRVGLIRSDGSANKIFPGAGNRNDIGPRWVNDSLVVFFSNRSGSYDIWYLNLNSGIFWRLAAIAGNEASPAPRPGAPGLAFAEIRPGGTSLDGRIVLIPDTAAAFSDNRYLSPDSLHAGEPDWDPTGTRVCFSASGSDQVRHLWLTTISGIDTTLTQLTTGSVDDANPRVSPDGSRIAFYSTRNGHPGIWVMGIGGESSGLREVATEDPGTDLTTPCWSPDGHVLVAASNGRIVADRYRQQYLWLILNLGL